jgi:peptidyl-prolyl cis-trans isomerase A (cyclophilin A)
MISKRGLLVGAAGLASAAAWRVGAQDKAPGVMISTMLGDILIELAADKAPITSANFLRYVSEKRFDGAGFYRAVKIPGASSSGLIQGGLQNDPAKVLAPIAHEPTTQTGLSHRDGTVSMARYAPGSAAAEFFICLGDQTYLDADPKAQGDNQGFAAFGRVARGMDVAGKILASPVSSTMGEGAMKGQMLDPVITFIEIRNI